MGNTAPALTRPGNRQDDLRAMLQALRLSGMAGTFPALALKAAKEGLTHEAFLYELASHECAQRAQQRGERRLRQSGLPREKTFATVQLDHFGPALHLAIERLRDGTFVDDAVNVVAVGRPGAGKSHVAAALGHDLIAHGHPVL